MAKSLLLKCSFGPSFQANVVHRGYRDQFGRSRVTALETRGCARQNTRFFVSRRATLTLLHAARILFVLVQSNARLS